MKVRTYPSAEALLEEAGPALEENEAANSLMLGICGQLARHPELYQITPCLKTVTEEAGVILAALMTPPHKLVVSGHRGDPLPAASLLIDDLLRVGWHVPGVMGTCGLAALVAETWAARTGQVSLLVAHQRLYELRQPPTQAGAPGQLRRATQADVELVAGWRDAFHREIFGHTDEEQSARVARLRVAHGDIYLWEAEKPVSMAIRTRPTRHGISISLVYTPPEQRGHGYATACVGVLSRRLLASGWAYCTLFADAANPASNRVYLRLGYRPVADFHEIEFVAES